MQEAIDAGASAIQLGAGEYPIDAPLTPTPGCTIRGIGEQTVLTAVADLPTVVAIGAGGPVGGVTVADLVVDAAGRADLGVDLDVVGTGGNLRGEPDAVCRPDALWVLDARLDGIAYRGTDTQATITSRVRVRRAGRHGYRIEAPDNVWVACEATTRGTDGAGFWIGTAIDGSDGIGAANLHFHACKAWYCHGVGWEVGTGRNTFTGCEAQDTASHGWRITAPRNTFTGCSADTAGMADVGGRPDAADGFSVALTLACAERQHDPRRHAFRTIYPNPTEATQGNVEHSSPRALDHRCDLPLFAALFNLYFDPIYLALFKCLYRKTGECL